MKMLLTPIAALALKGETRMDWRPEGLICDMVLPGEALEPAAVG